jgi:hypothetical protein
MLSVIFAECRYDICRCAKCHCAECRHAECHGALKTDNRLGVNSKDLKMIFV